MNQMDRNKVVIVGGGPVGLFTAIQAKIRNPKLEITVLDKNPSYARTQKLKLSPGSFAGIPSDSKLKEIVEKFKKKKFVAIQDIVSELKVLAIKKGIKIEDATIIGSQGENKSVKNAIKVDAIAKKYGAGIIIGADGAHSVVREVIFENEFKNNSSVEFLAQVTYDVAVKSEKLKPFNKSVLSKDVGALVEESATDKQVNLRFFVNKKTFESIKNAKASDPWAIDDPKIPAKLKKQITSWMDARKKAFNESPSNVKLTTIELKIYNSKKTVIENDGVTYCLVGDAAGGVPYFRSINKGFKEATQLAKAIANNGDPSVSSEKISAYWSLKSRWDTDSYKGNPALQFRAYASYAKSNAAWENLGARIKTFFINTAIVLIQTAGMISPSSWMEWSKKHTFKKQPKYGIQMNSALTTY